MEELLQKTWWNNKDIKAYVKCGTNKASQIRQRAIKYYDGFNPLLPLKVKRDAVLKVLEEFKWARKKNLMQGNGLYIHT